MFGNVLEAKKRLLTVSFFTLCLLSFVSAESLTLVYRNSFESEDSLLDWVMEGPGVAEIDDGRLLIHSKWQPQLEQVSDEIPLTEPGGEKYYSYIERWVRAQDSRMLKKYLLGQASDGENKGKFSGGHIQYWNRNPHPENFVIRMKFRAANPYPLHMVTFCARGVNGEDVLDPGLAPRYGLAAQYMWGDIRNYRISYWSGTRGTSNMRRAPGRKLTAEERADVPGYALDKEVQLEIIRWNGRVVFKCDGEILVDWTDDEPLGEGFFSLRLMAAARGWYDDYEVYELHADPFASTDKGLSFMIERNSVPRPKYLNAYYPNEETVIRANPVPFLWPAKDGVVESEFKLGRTPDLDGPDTVEETVPWSFAYPGKKLDTGTWYWRVNDGPVQSFVVPEKVDWSMEIPPFREVSRKIPSSYPRLLLFEGEREAFNARISEAYREEIIANADLFLATSLKDIAPPEIDFSRIRERVVMRLAINQTKGFLSRVKTPIVYLAKAWLLTGDLKYGEKCVELSLGIRNLDPRLVGLNDFTRTAVQDTLVYAIDSCYALFDEADRAVILEMIRDGAALEYGHFVRRLESQIFDNHTWQKTYASLLRSAIVLHGQEDVANEWLHYCYKLWFARAPATGFNYDGGWHNGTGYLTANMVTLIQVPLLWARIAGVSAFDHPWYRNSAESILYTFPAASYSSGFGDGHSSQTHPHWKRGVFMALMAKEQQNPYAAWYVEQLAQWKHGRKKRLYDPNAKHQLDNEALEWFLTLSDKPTPEAIPPADLPPARLMPDSGYASIHTQLEDLDEDVHIVFRANPYGSGSHCLASQNAFNIIAGGKPLFLSSGYYTSFSDKHTLLHYRHSRGHNTILADGIGQSIGSHGYGQFKRFLSNGDLTYVMGDASSAYGGGLIDPMWVKKFREAGIKHSRENGFGDAGVTRYHRHLIYIESIQALVIYDDLVANKAVEWSWLLHSPNKLVPGPASFYTTSNGSFTGEVWTVTEEMVEGTISTNFYSPAINWQKAKAYDGSVRELPDQWHLSVNSTPKAAMRYFTIIQIRKNGTPAVPVHWANGEAVIGDWEIVPQLDANHPASLKVSEAGVEIFDLENPAIGKVEVFYLR